MKAQPAKAKTRRFFAAMVLSSIGHLGKVTGLASLRTKETPRASKSIQKGANRRPMKITENQAKSILRKHKRIDSWFMTHYGMNLYRGCLHNCAYCDGRAERYYVEGEFGRDITVKTNAIEILERELNPARKRIPFKRSYMLVGGGVGDSYGPPELQYRLTRRVLALLNRYEWPVHVLTKSVHVREDLALIEEINSRRRAIVSFSFSTVDPDISALVEPGVPPPAKRLETMAAFKAAGIAVGMMLMPVIPFISDTPHMIDAAVAQAAACGADFVLFGAMTLKAGRQKDHFLTILYRHFPQFAVEYEMLYRDDKWGHPQAEYNRMVYGLFRQAARQYKMPIRIPPHLFNPILTENDRVIVMLEHMDYVLKAEGKKSTYGYAATRIAGLDRPVSQMEGRLRDVPGVGPRSETAIREIINTGSCAAYRKLLG